MPSANHRKYAADFYPAVRLRALDHELYCSSTPDDTTGKTKDRLVNDASSGDFFLSHFFPFFFLFFTSSIKSNQKQPFKEKKTILVDFAKVSQIERQIRATYVSSSNFLSFSIFQSNKEKQSRELDLGRFYKSTINRSANQPTNQQPSHETILDYI